LFSSTKIRIVFQQHWESEYFFIKKTSQTTLFRLLEDWRNALDNNQYVAAFLMDLSKAFDCLSHDIVLDKLSAYGMSTDSVSLLQSYSSNRKQQIEINSILSSWADIQKGAPKVQS
jgi:hypothetical protein